MSAALYALIFFITGCPGLYSCLFRSRLRKQYNLEGNICGDCLRHFWCEPCALTQEYRELKNRGFDMYIGLKNEDLIVAGWHANVEKNPGLAMAPVVEKGMTK
ncbi:hypothetical protein V6N11_055152 [Hibiscus sabdariffa]|uniref:Uncharacterized protein n=2 Tax=Hibiscus sabdariffa TaxID=183260 RepID=A0ABR2C061_9ROSI